MVIRGISDFGDEFKDDRFHTFASCAKDEVRPRYRIPISGAYDGAHYIIPMCHGCNMIKTRDLPVDSRVRFAPANISTCTVYVRERR